MSRIKEQFRIGDVFAYFLRVFKKDKSGKYPTSINLKMMHGINKISIVVFLICIIVMVVRAIMR